MHTVVIVEPHPLFRLGLRQLLSEVLPQLSFADHDYSSLESSSPPAAPGCDLLLLSLASTRSPEKLVNAAVKRFAPKRILLLAENDDTPEKNFNLPSCVAGCVGKEAPPEILQASVRLVLAGGSCFPAHSTHVLRPSVSFTPQSTVGLTTDPARYEPAKWSAGSTVARPQAPVPDAPSTAQDKPEIDISGPMKPGSAAHRESRLLGLTPRQYEVLVLLARGYPMKKVGTTLNISVATAKAHTETLYQRLDVHNRNAAVYAAVSRGATLGWAHMPEGRTPPDESTN